MTDYKGGLAKKLAEVIGATGWVEKRGTAPEKIGGFKFARAVDIYETVRKELSDRHIALAPGVNTVHHEPKGEKGILTTITGDMSFIDGDTGEVITFPFAGAGQDAGDKGLYKAITGGVRDALKAMFLLPTGDDPEAPDETDKSTRSSEASTGSRQSTTSPTAPKPPAAEKVAGKLTDAQKKKLVIAAKERGLVESAQRHNFYLLATGKNDPNQLTSADLDKALAELADLDSKVVEAALATTAVTA